MNRNFVAFLIAFACVVNVILLGFVSVEGITAMEEYCLEETFVANCGNDEVIVVNEATFGRMRTGKCISESFAYFMGCSANVLSVMEHQCSGRTSCSVPVFSLMANFRNCTSQLKSYLEIYHSCIKVTVPEGRCQSSPSNLISNLPTEGYLSSYFAQQTGCGNSDHPWVLQAGVGQRINVTLIDFTSDQAISQETDGNLCLVYATIREGNGAVIHTVCGGRKQKVVPVFMSVSNIIDIRFITKLKQTTNNGAQFLLKYKVEGCSDPDLPAAMWMRRDAHEALVACRVDTPTRWILKCVNGKWEGQVGICPAIPALSGSASASSSLQSYVGQSLPAKTPISYQDNEHNVAIIAASKSERDGAFFTKDMMIIIVSMSAVTISLLIFILGIIYLRRKANILRYHSPLQANQITYGQTVPTLPPSRDYTANTRRDINSSTMSSFKYYSTAKTARHPPPPSYEMYPTNRKSISSIMQTSMYPCSEISSAYNTVNHCQSSKDHIYESTFGTDLTTAMSNDKADDNDTGKHDDFVPEFNVVQSD